MRINPDALRSIRERTGMSIRQLAAESGVSFSHVAALERGEKRATGAVIRKLAAALQVPSTAISLPLEEVTT